jgi:pimeloyl-ACP methyl ester carboxylesterase
MKSSYEEEGRFLMVHAANSKQELPNRPSRGRSPYQRIGRVALVFAFVLVLLALIGQLYQGVAGTLDASAYPPPGQLIDVGGYRLHLYCLGRTSPGKPTVILESGLGGTSLDWRKVQPGVAHFTRVCSYERAGYGWSDSSPNPRTSQQIVTELHTLLVKASVPGPYVLVGHSFGGLQVQLFAFVYPQEVAGLVLVDSQSGDLINRSSTFRTFISQQAKSLSIFSLLAPFGLTRLATEVGIAPVNFQGYPPDVQPIAKAFVEQTRFSSSAHDEAVGMEQSMSQVRAARHPLGKIPLVVLTRGVFTPSDEKALWLKLQQDLVHLSSIGKQVMALHSGHAIMLDQPDLVIAAIKQVVTGEQTTSS